MHVIGLPSVVHVPSTLSLFVKPQHQRSISTQTSKADDDEAKVKPGCLNEPNMTELVQHKQANVYLARTLTVLWYICWPIGILLYYLAIAILFVLKLLYRPVGFVLQPVVYFGRFILACLIAPFRLLVKFETLYIYLGIAAIVGLVIGLVVSYVYGSLSRVLAIDSSPEPPATRTGKQYREAKLKQRAKVQAPIMSPGPLSPTAVSPSHISMSDSMRKGRRSKGLLNQTIMEEVDSEY